MTEDIPEWVNQVSDEEWQKMGKESPSYTNCHKCNKRIVLTLSDDSEPNKFCVEHCLKHKWQSDYDWPTECGKCGINYTEYLQSLLDKHNIKYDIP